MKIIPRNAFSGMAEIEQRINAFRLALAEHAKTVGVPAPREDELIEQLARTWEPFTIEPEPTPPTPPTRELLALIVLEGKRAAALRALDERRLAQAIADPAAPQEVIEYATAILG